MPKTVNEQKLIILQAFPLTLSYFFFYISRFHKNDKGVVISNTFGWEYFAATLLTMDIRSELYIYWFNYVHARRVDVCFSE